MCFLHVTLLCCQVSGLPVRQCKDLAQVLCWAALCVQHPCIRPKLLCPVPLETKDFKHKVKYLSLLSALPLVLR